MDLLNQPLPKTNFGDACQSAYIHMALCEDFAGDKRKLSQVMRGWTTRQRKANRRPWLPRTFVAVGRAMGVEIGGVPVDGR